MWVNKAVLNHRANAGDDELFELGDVYASQAGRPRCQMQTVRRIHDRDTYPRNRQYIKSMIT
jgi:hypothetical protein